MHSPELRLRLVAVALLLCLANGQEDGEKSHSTSVAGMVDLLKVEAQLIENLSYYADELEEKLQIVRRWVHKSIKSSWIYNHFLSSFVAEMTDENKKANSQTELYLANPLNAFSLIRRMHHDWTHWQHYMQQPLGEAQVEFLNRKRELLPSSTDLEEAAESIHRIVGTYDLKVSDMAKGLINGKQYKWVDKCT